MSFGFSAQKSFCASAVLLVFVSSQDVVLQETVSHCFWGNIFPPFASVPGHIISYHFKIILSLHEKNGCDKKWTQLKKCRWFSTTFLSSAGPWDLTVKGEDAMEHVVSWSWEKRRERTKLDREKEQQERREKGGEKTFPFGDWEALHELSCLYNFLKCV